MSDLAEVRIAAGCARALRGPGGGRHGQARRARAQRVLRHRPRVPLPGGAPRRAGALTSAPAGALIRLLLARSPRTASCSASTCGCGPTATRARSPCNFDALEHYFVTQGREWERYAWLKARPLTGDRARRARRASCGRSCSASTSTTPRSPRCATLHAEVRARRRAARARRARQARPRRHPRDRVHRAGAAAVRGGRDAELRGAADAAGACAACRDKSLLPRSRGARARRRLRVPAQRRAPAAVPRRRADATTCREDDEDRAPRRAGCAASRRWDRSSYDAAAQFRAAGRVAPLRGACFAEPRGSRASAVARRIRALAALRASQRYAALPDALARSASTRWCPALARAAARRRPIPQATLARGVDLVEAIASRAAYLALLAEHPRGARARRAHDRRLELGGRVRHAPSAAARRAARRPAAVRADRLARRSRTSLRAQLAAAARRHRAADERPARGAPGAGVPPARAGPRRAAHGRAARRPPVRARRPRARGDARDACWRDLRGAPPRARRASRSIGYGKLGGKELGYASDLDIIFLLRRRRTSSAAGGLRAPRAAPQHLAHQHAPPSGMLFETDLRLRPSGASGLLVSAVEAFERYQRGERVGVGAPGADARALCAGDAAVGAAFEAHPREDPAPAARNPPSSAKDIVEMRDKHARRASEHSRACSTSSTTAAA